jgi:hypothetical protein
VRRGANLANIDVRLNDRLWLQERFAEIRATDGEEQRLSGVQAILDWPNPGPGGFYDDLGRVTAQPHLVAGRSYEDDPQYFESPQVAFGGGVCPSGHRLSWCRLVDGAYGHEVKLHYPHLDPEGAYRVRLVYAGRLAVQDYEMADRSLQGTPVMVRLTADDLEVHPLIPKPNPVQPVEFDVPVEATRDGELTLGCTSTVAGDSPRRGCQIAEVWLMRR